MRTRVRRRITLFPAIFAVLSTLATTALAHPTERVSPAPQCNPNAVVWRTPKPPANPQAADIWINPKDRAETVWVPAGTFLMGTSDRQAQTFVKQHPGATTGPEKPQRQVYLDGYWVYKHEVTVAQFAKFCTATKHIMPKQPWAGWGVGAAPGAPVVGVSWFDARLYAEWAGMGLPTEAQWEKAARGTDGRAYPWGNEWGPKKCNVCVSAAPRAVGAWPDDRSPYGVMDMAGSAKEWCSDWYDKHYYHVSPPAKNPQGPSTGRFRVQRGSSWQGSSGDAPCSRRGFGNPNHAYSDYGFRCVLAVRPGTPP